MRQSRPNLAILGLQWGDEGKGKLVDLLSEGFRHAVRFQGGNNAGHTVVVKGESIALHQIPSGALHPDCHLSIGSGVVLNLEVLTQEMERLTQRGLHLMDRFLLSEKAHVILPHHIALDQWREKGAIKIGTTGRGIGPAYEMKASRRGIRLGDLHFPAVLRERMAPGYEEVAELVGKDNLPSLDAIVENLLKVADPLLPLIGDVQEHLLQAWGRGESILFEGAQAALLDIDHGTYPFVTSSNCTLGGLFTGTGLPPKALQTVIGVAKAYTTRVGAGPFPTELHDATGERIRQAGREFGTTTGRPRRCGWFDAAITRYACRTNGVDGLGLMKLDVLDGFDQVGMVTGYRDGEGRISLRVPTTAYEWEQVEPVVEMHQGWTRPTRGITRMEDMPQEAMAYLARLEEVAEAPIAYLSTGPDRVEGFTWPGRALEGLV